MQTRSSSSVLGKRAHHASEPTVRPSPASPDMTKSIPTPDITPDSKRQRLSLTIEDGTGNKENIPPFNVSPVSDGSPRRSLRRTSTQLVTPTRSRPPVRRHASTSNVSSHPPATPTESMAQLALSTPPPTPPTALLPVHSRVRLSLRASSATAVAGRDEERTTITTFLDQDEGSLYVSGAPGTGKTVLVNDILTSRGNIDAKVVVVNCMALPGLEALWDRIVQQVATQPSRNQRTKKNPSDDTLSSALKMLKTTCILVLDEVDHIAPSGSAALQTIFELATTYKHLRIIGIANTHTLTASASKQAEGVQTLHFKPYTPAQLFAIVKARLGSVFPSTDASPSPDQEAARRLLPEPTLHLLTKKVAAMTGDVRVLLEVLRGAIDLAVKGLPSTSKAESSQGPFKGSPAVVTPAHILAALKAHSPTTSGSSAASSNLTSGGGSSSEVVRKIGEMTFNARLVLLAVVLALTRIDAGLPLSTTPSASRSPLKRTASASTPPLSCGTDVGKLHTFYATVLERTDSVQTAVSRCEFGDLLGVLEGVGLVSLSSAVAPTASPTKKRSAFGRTASFGGLSKLGATGTLRGLVEGVQREEVLRGLGIDGQSGDILDEEMRDVWGKEKVRINREVKAHATASRKTGPDHFHDACED